GLPELDPIEIKWCCRVRFGEQARRLGYEQGRMLLLLIHNWPIVLFLTITLTLMIVALLSLRDGPLPYERRGGLLSPAEINFLRSLQLAAREGWLIFSMVRLADIIKVRPKIRKFQTRDNRIKGKHLDFVLCE